MGRELAKTKNGVRFTTKNGVKNGVRFTSRNENGV